MFKNGLLVSTAMTAAALLLSGAPGEAYAQTRMHAAPRDANARFLCTYGQFEVSYFHSGHSGSQHTDWTHGAVPVTGRGNLVKRIVVREGKNSRSADGDFFVGIYSNTASGHPGNLIAGGSATASSSCTKVEIPISPTVLQNRETYWIVEQARQQGGHAKRKLYWAIDPGTKRKAYVQTHSSSSVYSYTSPWKGHAKGPYLRLR